MAHAETGGPAGRPSADRCRAGDRPPQCRPGAARFRCLDRVRRRGQGAAGGIAPLGDAVRGDAFSGGQSGPCRGARQAPQTRGSARLAAAVRSRLGYRLVVLVRAPGGAVARPVAGIRLPSLQHADPRGRGGHGRGHRPPDADRAGVGTGTADSGFRPPGQGAGAVLPHYHGRLRAQIRGGAVPGMDTGAGQAEPQAARNGRRRPTP